MEEGIYGVVHMRTTRLMARAYVGGHKNLGIKRWVWDEKDQLFCHKN